MMRYFLSLFVLVLGGFLVGCSENGPAKPVEMTPEQEREFQEAEKKVENEERQYQRSRVKPATPEQEVEMQERARQRR